MGVAKQRELARTGCLDKKRFKGLCCTAVRCLRDRKMSSRLPLRRFLLGLRIAADSLALATAWACSTVETVASWRARCDGRMWFLCALRRCDDDDDGGGGF